jgi:hypothetical protein
VCICSDSACKGIFVNRIGSFPLCFDELFGDIEDRFA